MQQTIAEEFIATNIRKPLTGDKTSFITASQIAELIKTRTGLFLSNQEKVDIALNESIVRLVLNVLEVSQITSVCQLVEVDDVILRIFVHEKSYYV
jgi:hypothetical protein